MLNPPLGVLYILSLPLNLTGEGPLLVRRDRRLQRRKGRRLSHPHIRDLNGRWRLDGKRESRVIHAFSNSIEIFHILAVLFIQSLDILLNGVQILLNFVHLGIIPSLRGERGFGERKVGVLMGGLHHGPCPHLEGVPCLTLTLTLTLTLALKGGRALVRLQKSQRSVPAYSGLGRGGLIAVLGVEGEGSLLGAMRFMLSWLGEGEVERCLNDGMNHNFELQKQRL